MSTILQLAPQNVWKHFYSLTQIPRPSGHMEKITEFLVNFGKGLGLESFVDEIGNVIIRKAATPGMENRKGVILQAHMDMVPQKNNDTVHDFTKDPIETYIDGDWVKAKGTTLGADNGLGVAAIMAVLEDNSLKHGPLEALITKDEETGMYGAFGLKPGTSVCESDLVCRRHKAVVVSTADLTSLRDAERTAETMKKKGLRDARLVINKVDASMIKKRLAPNIDEIIESVSVRLIGVVPEDKLIPAYTYVGKFAYTSGAPKVRQAFSNIATRLCGGSAELIKL